MKKIQTLADLEQDRKNHNLGTERGRKMLEESIQRYGAGRSVLADKNGRLIAGNKTVEVAAEVGLPVRVVQTDGRELVVVQRTDLDLEQDRAARELSYADNRVSEIDFRMDPVQLADDVHAGLDLAPFFTQEELAEKLGASTPPLEIETHPGAGLGGERATGYRLSCGGINLMLTAEEHAALKQAAEDWTDQHGTAAGFMGAVLEKWSQA